MNIYDISQKAGVSIATVSRVLNGSAKVSAATRQKVLDIMRETGYMPNAFARSLGLNTMRTVGLLCADASDVHLARAVHYLERGLRENAYASMLCCTGYGLEEKREYLRLLLGRNVDAVLFVGSHFMEDTREDNGYVYEAAQKVPVFLLNGCLEGKNVYSVFCDDYEATRDMTAQILASGAKSPIYLNRSLSYTGRRKLAGFEDACRAYGLPQEQERGFLAPPSMRETVQFLCELQQEMPGFDAVLASDDELAVGAVKYALAQGKSIPGDFQVAGYNNSLLSTCSTPELSTVDNRVEFLCTTVVSLLMQVLQKKDVPSRTMFSATLVQRETTRGLARV